MQSVFILCLVLPTPLVIDRWKERQKIILEQVEALKVILFSLGVL